MAEQIDSSFYVTGGTLRHDAPSYVERQADKDLLDGLLQGEFCYVLTSRQMGKSSLMVRTAGKLRELGVQVAVLDLTSIGQNLTPEQWYDGLLVRLGRQLDLEDKLEEFWEAHRQVGPCQRLITALRDVVLPKLAGGRVGKRESGKGDDSPTAQPSTSNLQPATAAARLVLFVDEIDVVRSLPFSTDEFFAAIRECYNRRTEDADFNRLTFCLLGVASPSDLIRDVRLTPFNIGRRVELNDFTAAEAASLARGLQTGAMGTRDAELLLQRVLHWTNGHPYLTQRLCHALASELYGPERPPVAAPEERVDRLCQALFLSSRAREQDDNLLFVRERLLRAEVDRAGLLHLYERVVTHQKVRQEESNPLVNVFRLSGIIRLRRGRLGVRNRIYEQVFDREWIRVHMPGAEVRRQRAAFRRGVLRATSLAAVIVAVMALLVVYALRQKRNADTASFSALLARARSGRLSGLAGQRFEGLAALRQAAGIKPSPAVRNEAIACLALADLRPGTTRLALPTDTTAVTFNDSLDQYARSDARGNISVRRLPGDAEVLRLPGFGAGAVMLRFSPGNSYLAAAHSAGTERILNIWHLPSRQAVLHLTNAMRERAFDFSSDEQVAAVGGSDGVVRVFDLATGAVKNGVKLEGEPVMIRFRPGQRQVAVCSANSIRVEVHDLSGGKPPTSLAAQTMVRTLAWSADGESLAAAGFDKRIHVWRNLSPGALFLLEGHQAVADNLAFNRTGSLLVSSGADNTVRLWDPHREGKALATLEVSRAAQQLQFSADGQQLGCSLAGGELEIWNVAAGLEWRSLFDPAALSISQVDISPDGRLLACAHEDGVSLWDLPLGTRLCLLPLGLTKAALFNPASGDLITSDLGGVHRFFVIGSEDNQPGETQLEGPWKLDLPTQSLRMNMGNDEKTLAVAWDSHVTVLDPKTGAVRADLKAEPGLQTVALSPDGQWVAAANWRSNTVAVWDVATSNRLTVLDAKGRANLAVSPSGLWLAAGTEKACRIWRTGSWQEAKVLARQQSGADPAPVAFSPDGWMLAFARTDFGVELVDPSSGASLAYLEPPRKEPLVWLRFSPDSRQLACAAEGRSVQVWDLAAIRRGLAELGLDWKQPPYPAQPKRLLEPLRLKTDLLPIERSKEASRINLEAGLDEVTRDMERKRQQGRAEDALKLLRRRAVLLMRLGKEEAAIQDWKQYLSSTNDPWAHRDLASLYLFGAPPVRDFQAAKDEAGAAVSLERKNPDNHFRLGVACFRTGDYQTGLDHLQEAARLRVDKANAENLFYQAMCCFKLDRIEQATVIHARAAQAAQAEYAGREAPASLTQLKAEAKRLFGK